MILSKDQAEAVYSAMCVMNNVYGTMCFRLDGIRIEAWDSIMIEGPADGQTGACPIENYANQNAFATAYGLN